MQNLQNTKEYSNLIQLKLPLNIDTIIDISDPIYSFNEIISRIDLSEFAAVKGNGNGRPPYDFDRMLKVVLFSFMENGFQSLREIEKSCRNDIRYMWLLDGMKAPTFATVGNFINSCLKDSLENIFAEINMAIFDLDGTDLEHVYIDGTKIEADANRYSWVWKKSCIKSRDKVFAALTELIEKINRDELSFQSVRLGTRTEYTVEYTDELIRTYSELMGIDPSAFVSGRGHRKSVQQRNYEKLAEYRERLSKYAEHIEICGDKRNSYSKTDHDATFMRVKKDYMGNDQLLPAYNMQIGVCDEYIAVIDAQRFASDMDCFVPLMEKFHSIYGKYPKYPVGDAGYGSMNNYIYCQEHGMEKFLKFTMYEKEVKNQSYRENPYRAVNFTIDGSGTMFCPNGRKFIYKGTRPVKGNRYGRTEEIYVCENCEGCPYRQECCPKAKGNRQVQVNRELTRMHHEVIDNLCCTHGALLRMNRSIQAEGVYGSIKWNREYKRARRRGIEGIILEFTLIACGFNLYKYHNKKKRNAKAA